RLQPKEDSRLRRRAAGSAGEGRGDVGSDDNLLGRFFRRHLLSGRRGGAWRRLQQTAMLDDFFDLRTVEGLVLKQRFGNDFELGAIGKQRLLRFLISFVEQP